jgi:predicted DCC family thiol-disulfide oxidoreductase YuxK
VALAADGNLSRAALIVREHQRTQIRTWLFRLLAWLFTVVALLLVLQPLSVVADAVPLCGPLLASLVGSASCVVALTLGTSIFLFVALLGWVLFRPVLGVGFLLVAALLYSLTQTSASSRTAPRRIRAD